ncbi:MAG: alginate export family protein [Verrucomicrobiota bacterium]
MHAKLILSTALTVACGITASAQEKAGTTAMPTPPPAAGAGLLNDWLREESADFKAWDIGGQERVRFEYRSGMAVAGSSGAVDFSRLSPDNDFLLFRTKIHLGYNSPCNWFSVYAEGRDSRDLNDKRRSLAGTSYKPEEDTCDLQQAYVRLGDAKTFPLTAKVGRQELAYGDERLVGAFDWSNMGRVFDAAKLRYETTDLWVDAFSGRVVIPRDDTFNTVNDYDWFSGIYASTKTLIPRQETQLYFLARNASAQSPTAFALPPPALFPLVGARDIYTVGLRVKSTPGEWQGWDYEAELAGQFGRFVDAGKSLDQQAFAAHLAGGYTFTKTTATPRVGLEYNFSSGDSNPNDGKHETFDNLFPTNHKFYGFMDFLSLQNLHDVRLATSAKPAKNLTLTLDYHLFWLADTHDSFYAVNGTPRTTSGYGINPTYNSFVGSEIDLVASYAVKRWAALQAGYGHFFRGDYVKQSLGASGSKDADWIYLQAVVNF